MFNWYYNWQIKRQEAKAVRLVNREIQKEIRELLKRRGDTIIANLVEQFPLENNTNYKITNPRSYWPSNLRAGLIAAYPLQFNRLPYEVTNNFVQGQIRDLFGSDWDKSEITSFGLGYNIDTWRRIGQRIAVEFEELYNGYMDLE